MFAKVFTRGSIKRFLTIPDITQLVSKQNLLTGTGNGPFIELSQFHPLGTGSDLLNVKMPQSSNLSIRYGSLIAMNGNLKGVSSVPRKLGESYYQILQSEESVSLLIGGKIKPNCMNNYLVVEVEKGERWTVFNDHNLVAWTGYDFLVLPQKVVEKWNSVLTEGRGRMLLNDGNRMYEVEIQPDEKMYLSPNSLIASNQQIDFVPLKTDNKMPTINSMVKYVRVPKMPNWIKNLKIKVGAFISKISMPVSPETKDFLHHYATRTRYHISNVALFVRLYLLNWLFSKPIFVEVKGPGKVLISGNIHTKNNIPLTKQEINIIYSKKI